ncbi:hypothetical protein, partial [Paracoccus aestuariivivens]|uniref:hypothetical protein n=1 Tax=Paracoccus aestuariivivens TaxID=1820333 RepID=UPI001B8B5E91
FPDQRLNKDTRSEPFQRLAVSVKAYLRITTKTRKCKNGKNTNKSNKSLKLYCFVFTQHQTNW